MDVSAVTFRLAGSADLEKVLDLVHSAYRGDESRLGWTTEADYLDGQRTDLEELRHIVGSDDQLILVGELDSSIMSSCHLRQIADGAMFAMFAVRPTEQRGGMGASLLVAAEHVAIERWSATTMRMYVIEQREELLSWYARRGYRPTGERIPFPYGNERAGIPKRDDLAFVVLSKALV